MLNFQGRLKPFGEEHATLMAPFQIEPGGHSCTENITARLHRPRAMRIRARNFVRVNACMSFALYVRIRIRMHTRARRHGHFAVLAEVSGRPCDSFT